MKFIHISDLHLGKRLNDINLLEDQKYVLNQVLHIAQNEQIDGIIIAGDIYQRLNPSDEAMALFDYFLEQLALLSLNIFIIAGNHDSSQKVAYLSNLIQERGIYIAKSFSGKLQKFVLNDQYGKINIHMLPYIKPINVRKFYPNTPIDSYEKAVKCVLSSTPVDCNERNILIAHQYITNADLAESEELSLGGMENIDASVFEDFDYVALGHVHKAQKCLRDTIRYSGSILKYSLAEANQKKSITILEIKEKGNITIQTVPLTFLHDLRVIKGTMEEVLSMPYSEDYVGITLTDEEVDPDARVTIGVRFPNMIKFGVDNSKTKMEYNIFATEKIENKTVTDLFVDFYKLQNNDALPSKASLKIVEEVLNKIERGEK